MAYAARFDQDNYHGDDFVLVKTPEGQATLLPLAARRLSGDALEAYADTMKLALQVDELERRLVGHVDELREHGVSWNLIGSALGLTGEGARLRYGSVRE